MESRLSRRALLLGMLALGLPVSAGAEGFPGGLRDAYGPRFGPRLGLRDLGDRRRRHGAGAAGNLRHWNELAVDASGLDHTPAPPGARRVFGGQVGPGGSGRALAIGHAPAFDPMNA